MMVDNDLQTEENIELILPENAPPSFHLLAKPTGNENDPRFEPLYIGGELDFTKTISL